MLGLRTYEGVDLRAIETLHDVELEEPNSDLIDRLRWKELVYQRAGRVLPTLEGLAVADSLARAFEIREPRQ